MLSEKYIAFMIEGDEGTNILKMFFRPKFQLEMAIYNGQYVLSRHYINYNLRAFTILRL